MGVHRARKGQHPGDLEPLFPCIGEQGIAALDARPQWVGHKAVRDAEFVRFPLGVPEDVPFLGRWYRLTAHQHGQYRADVQWAIKTVRQLLRSFEAKVGVGASHGEEDLQWRGDRRGWFRLAAEICPGAHEAGAFMGMAGIALGNQASFQMVQTVQSPEPLTLVVEHGPQVMPRLPKVLIVAGNGRPGLVGCPGQGRGQRWIAMP